MLPLFQVADPQKPRVLCQLPPLQAACDPGHGQEAVLQGPAPLPTDAENAGGATGAVHRCLSETPCSQAGEVVSALCTCHVFVILTAQLSMQYYA